MKRIVAPALLLLCVLFLLPSRPSSAQQAEEKKPAVLQWENIREGVQVLKLWESVGPRWPEIAILRLSKTEYATFFKNPVNFLNEGKVYPHEYPAKRVVRCRLVSPKTAKSEYVVVLNHDPNSTSTTISSSNVVFDH